MGLQNMVYTAFLGQSKEIFVTGMNAYADSKIYRKGVKSYGNNLQHYSNNIRRHEPISNFCLIKNFVKMKIVGGDENFLRVFNLSPEEYAKKLDENLNSLGYKPLLSDYESRFSKFYSL